MSLSTIAADPFVDAGGISPVPETPMVELIGVRRSWGRGAGRREVLRDLDLEIGAGTAISVSGRNGAGKTTLLRILTGILAPDSGIVLVDGLRPTDGWREYHRRIGFLSAGD